MVIATVALSSQHRLSSSCPKPPLIVGAGYRRQCHNHLTQTSFFGHSRFFLVETGYWRQCRRRRCKLHRSWLTAYRAPCQARLKGLERTVLARKVLLTCKLSKSCCHNDLEHHSDGQRELTDDVTFFEHGRQSPCNIPQSKWLCAFALASNRTFRSKYGQTSLYSHSRVQSQQCPCTCGHMYCQVGDCHSW